MLARSLVRALRRAPLRAVAVRPFAAKASDAPAAGDKKSEHPYGVNPEDPVIAPTIIPWQDYKNQRYAKRGFTVADKDWKEWSDLPEGPFKYLGVKVNPDHVLNHGPVWKFFSDWRTGLPAAFALTMPMWMFNVLPGFDEKTELSLIVFAAGFLAIKTAGPFFRQFKRSRVAVRVKALLAHESQLNAEISEAIDAYKAGSNVVSYAKTVNDAERALRALEAQAATRRIACAQRDAVAAQLDFLVTLSSAGAAGTETATIKAARSSVEAQLEKDAKLQQASIESAIKALTAGAQAPADDVIAPLFAKALDAARAEAAKSAEGDKNAKPLRNPQLVEIFRKRFGLVDDVVTEGVAEAAAKDAAARAVLVGKVGGAEPKVGTPFVIKPAIAYAK